jgi:hypothetical protein
MSTGGVRVVGELPLQPTVTTVSLHFLASNQHSYILTLRLDGLGRRYNYARSDADASRPCLGVACRRMQYARYRPATDQILVTPAM